MDALSWFKKTEKAEEFQKGHRIILHDTFIGLILLIDNVIKKILE